MTSTIKEHLIAAHTPGPWGVFEPYLGEVQTPDQKTIASCWHAQNEDAEITVVGINPCSLEESAANACLIAAAPEMLEACRQAAELHEDDEGISRVLFAAIAKAEGRQP